MAEEDADASQAEASSEQKRSSLPSNKGSTRSSIKSSNRRSSTGNNNGRGSEKHQQQEAYECPAEQLPDAETPCVPACFMHPQNVPCPRGATPGGVDSTEEFLVEEEDESDYFCMDNERPLTATTLQNKQYQCSDDAHGLQRRSFFLIQWLRRLHRSLCEFDQPNHSPFLCLLGAIFVIFSYLLVWAFTLILYVISNWLHLRWTPCLRKQLREAWYEINRSLRELSWIPHVALSQALIFTYWSLAALFGAITTILDTIGYSWDVLYAAVTGTVPNTLKTAIYAEKAPTHKTQIMHPLLPFPSGYDRDVVFPIFGKACIAFCVIDPTGERNYSWSVEPPPGKCPSERPEISLKSLLNIKRSCVSEWGSMDRSDLNLELRSGGAATLTVSDCCGTRRSRWTSEELCRKPRFVERWRYYLTNLLMHLTRLFLILVILGLIAALTCGCASFWGGAEGEVAPAEQASVIPFACTFRSLYNWVKEYFYEPEEKKWESPIACKRKPGPQDIDENDPCWRIWNARYREEAPQDATATSEGAGPETEDDGSGGTVRQGGRVHQCCHGGGRCSLTEDGHCPESKETVHTYRSSSTGEEVAVKRVEAPEGSVNQLLNFYPNNPVSKRIKKFFSDASMNPTMAAALKPYPLPMGGWLRKFYKSAVRSWVQLFGGDENVGFMAYHDGVASKVTKELWAKHVEDFSARNSQPTSELFVTLDPTLSDLTEELIDRLATEKSGLNSDSDPPKRISIAKPDDNLKDQGEGQLVWLDYQLTKHLSRNSVVIIDGLDKLRERAARHLLFHLVGVNDGRLMIFRIAASKVPPSMKMGPHTVTVTAAGDGQMKNGTAAGSAKHECLSTNDCAVRQLLEDVWKGHLKDDTRRQLAAVLTRSITVVGGEE